MIQDSLRYWVTEMHVDGFRFDLASILSRDEDGHPLPNPPVLWDIESDPLLAGTKLIAEAWDAAGLYQVGSFIGDTWQEWNGRFRDDVRRFVKGDDDTVSGLATRLLGSPDIYGHEEREAEQSINFVTCHDGFTLNDLVSYNDKHNEANGENNRDGSNDNLSWNCGVEGPTDDPGIEALRNRQVKNFLALQLLAAGTPMLLMGDEVRRTQHGNNNAYCQDNEISWFDWSLLERHADVHRFVRELTRVPSAPRCRGPAVAQPERAAGAGAHRVARRQHWTSRTGATTRIPSPSPCEACARASCSTGCCNAYWEPLTFELPPRSRATIAAGDAVSTRRSPSPDDIHPWAQAPIVAIDQLRGAAALGGGPGVWTLGAGAIEPAVPVTMTIHPRAGTLAPADLLVDVGALRDEYYTRTPDVDGTLAARELRHERPPRIVAARHVQRSARARDHPGDLRLPHARSASPVRSTSAGTRTRSPSRPSRRRSRCWRQTASRS